MVLPAPLPSRRVLAAGMVISGQNQTLTNMEFRQQYTYSGLLIEAGCPVRCAHLPGRMPSGDNVAMLDGSAKWRKFSDMLPRSIPFTWGIWW